MAQRETINLHSDDLVKELDDQTVLLVRGLLKKGIIPHLAVVAIGDTAKSPFIRLKKQRARRLGVEVSVYELPASAPATEIKRVLEWLNNDAETQGIIIQLPLSAVLKPQQTAILEMIEPVKDVDALGRGKLVSAAKDLKTMEAAAVSQNAFLPTTAHAILKICAAYNINLTQPTVIVGKGKLVGQPLLELITALGGHPAYVDKRSPDLHKAIYNSTLILAGTSATRPFLADNFVQEGSMVIAAGREIDYPRLQGYAGGMTPAKGGVGPLTISLLFNNLARSCVTQTT